jgi:hypothetical protein
MDLETARQILGVTAETPSDEIRRTYLRLVRRHSPEAAPQEFQRIRAAYDLLREREAAPRGPAPDVPAPSASPEGTAPPAGADASFEAVLAELGVLSPFAAEGRAAVVERAYRAHPGDLRFVWLALEEMVPFSPVHGRLRALLRDAADRGHAGALEHLTFFGPRLVRPDELAALLGSDNPAAELMGARVLVATGDAAGAAEVVEEVVRRSTRVLPAGLVIDVGFAALAASQVPAATRVRAALDAHFETFHDQAAVLTPALAAMWGVFLELLALSRDFPASAIICVARVARGDSLEMPIEVGRTLLTLPGMPQDKKMVALLASRAPFVSQLIDMPTAFNTFGWHTTHNTWQDVLKAVAFLIVVFGGRALLCSGIEQAVSRPSLPSGYVPSYAPSSSVPSGSTSPPVPDLIVLPSELKVLEEQTCASAAHQDRMDCQEILVIEAQISSGKCDRELAGFKLVHYQSPTVLRARMLAQHQALKNCQAAASGGAP